MAGAGAGLSWQEVGGPWGGDPRGGDPRDAAPAGAGEQVATSALLRLVAGAGLGGALAADAANIRAGDEEVAERRRALNEVARPVPGWPGAWTPVMGWLAAPPPAGEERERALCEALAARAATVERSYRAFCAGPLTALVQWLESHGERWLGLAAADCGDAALAMLDACGAAGAASPPNSSRFPSLAAAARFALYGGPPASPPPAEMMDRLGGVVADMRLSRDGWRPARFRLWRGQEPRGRCRLDGDTVVAEVELSGRYRDVVTVFHEAGHALHFAGAGTKGQGTAGIVVAEGFAHLFGQLGRDPRCAGRWLAGCESWGAWTRLLARRSAAAKWLSALAGQGDPERGLASYAEGQARSFSAPFAPGLWLADDASAHGWLVYLLATLLAAALTAALRREAGREWFHSPRAGDLVRRWMSEDARRPAAFLAFWLRRGADFGAGL